MRLRIGTRGSALALWQARHVASIIEQSNPGVQVGLTIIKTTGDKILDSPLAQIPGKGLFTKEIEEALLENRVDLAVHSMKDVPTELPEGLRLGAIMEREDPRDVFVSADGRGPAELREGERVGTSSLRRRAFLLNSYPYLDVTPIRGNVDTRIKKIETENLAGVLLAGAGIKRMGLEHRITSYLEPDFMIPAIGQGALGLEIREDDPDIAAIVGQLNHDPTARCVRAERAFLRRMGGGCQVPLAAYAVEEGSGIKLTAAVVHPDGNPTTRESMIDETGSASVGRRLADSLVEKGADSIMRSVAGDEWAPGPVTED